MPAYNFKEEFSSAVELGEKTQTIRKPRKRPTKEGEMLYLYTGMRTKGCRKLGEAECCYVGDFEIDSSGVFGYLDGERLTPQERETVAKNDGFNNWWDMVYFFEDLYGLPFRGKLISWEHWE